MRTDLIPIAATAALILAGCKASEILAVPAPAGVTPSSSLNSQVGAESEFAAAQYEAFQGLVSSDGGPPVTTLSGLLADEFRWGWFEAGTIYAYYGANVDARHTRGFSFYVEVQDKALQQLMYGRAMMLLAIPPLEQYEPKATQSLVGEAFANLGLVELSLAENWCAGIPLDRPLAGGGIEYGHPLTTDSLLGVAQAHFDSAIAHAQGVDSVVNLAHIGLGRALLDRGRFSDADTAVAVVPTSFTFSASYYYSYAGANYSETSYSRMFNPGNASFVNVADRKGGNGLDFATANDPRLVIDSSQVKPYSNGTFYFPVRFGEPPGVTQPVIGGIEARLIQAEAALHAGNVATWASDLNALRADAQETGFPFDPARVSLPADSTTAASTDLRVDVMFRERAFWLFGYGTRLSDMRRLIRQYGRSANAVFAVGPYPYANDPSLPAALPTYGTDVSLSLPTTLGQNITRTTNPYYTGCIDKGA